MIRVRAAAVKSINTAAAKRSEKNPKSIAQLFAEGGAIAQHHRLQSGTLLTAFSQTNSINIKRM